MPSQINSHYSNLGGDSKIYTIYKYTNKKNGKVYIGQTSKTLEERARTNGFNYRGCRRFYNAIERYGWSSFEPEILEEVNSVEEANEREIYYINLYKSTDEEYGYNIAQGGDCKVASDETRKLISDNAKERYKDKTKNPMYGRKHSEETLKKQREKKLGANNPMFGRHWNETQREKCGTKGKHLNLSEDQRQVLSDRMREIALRVRPKAVLYVEDNIRFPSMTAAAEKYGSSISNLCGCLKGRQNTCRGKHFVYVN